MEVNPIGKSELEQFKREWDKVATSVVWDPKLYSFGLFEEDQCVGYTSFETNGGVGHLHELIVKENYRARGYGRNLITHFIDFCKKNGCHKLTLKTSEEHKEAIKFYENLGFEIEATHLKDKNNLTWYTYVMYLK